MVATLNAPAAAGTGYRGIWSGEQLSAAMAMDLVNSASGITAGAGGTLGAASQLIIGSNRVTVCNTPGDSVVLPVSTAGASCVVSNDTSNYIQVYAMSGDTLEDATTSQIMLAGNDATFICDFPGKWYLIGSVSPADGLTAAGTNRATAFSIQADWNNFTTAASSTGAVLPPGQSGMEIIIFNNGASAMQIYGNGSDTIDGTAGATGVTLTNALRCAYFCLTNGKWLSSKLGATST